MQCEHIIQYCSGYEDHCKRKASHVLLHLKYGVFYNGKLIISLCVCDVHLNTFNKTRGLSMMTVNEFLVQEVMNS